MNRIRALLQLALADFRERTRRYSFLLTMLGVLFFGYLVITGKYTIQFGDLRPVYDSEWAGTLMAVCGGIMLALFGFYLVRGTIRRDRQTEVGQIIGATPISTAAYLMSKLASNFLVLWVIVVMLAVVALLTLLFRNEAASVDMWSFVSPFLLITGPVTVFVAATAILFDTVRWLRGSLGNVVYLFAAEFCLVFGMLKVPWLDLGAVAVFTNSARDAAAAAFPGEKIGLLMGFVMFDDLMQVTKLRTFPWNGIDWTPSTLLLRASWLVAALGTVSLAIPYFDRFDPSRISRKVRQKRVRPAEVTSAIPRSAGVPALSYAEMTNARVRFRLAPMALAELRLALKGYHWFWYIVAVGLVAAQFAAPFDVTREYVVPLAMAWPLVIWSSMGTRESRYNTGQLLFSCPDPVGRQLPAVWLSGAVVALAAIGPMFLRALACGQAVYALALIVGAFFVPSAALVLGITSGSKKLFEVLYLMVWYIGSIDHLTPLDLLGTTDAAITGGKMVILTMLTATSLVVAFLTRRLHILRG